MKKILFVIPYEEGEKVVKEVLAEQAFRDRIACEMLFADVGEKLTVSAERADAVISRGYTTVTMETTLPKVELAVTGFDIMRAVKSCIRDYGSRKIAVIGTFNMVYGAEEVGEFYSGVEVECRTLEQEEYLEKTILEMRGKGTEAFIGGRSLYQKAVQLGFPAVLLGFGREAVSKSLGEAVRAVEIRRLEQAKRTRIQTILDYTFEGILSTDEQGCITMANQYAQQVLGGRLEGVPLTSIFHKLAVDKVLREGERCLSQIYPLEKMTVTVNCVPWLNHGTVLGTVTTFQDITKIQEEEERIRKQLHQRGFVVKYHFDDIIYQCEKMRETAETARKFAQSDSNLFIYGETGTGKELFAQSIHNDSKRKQGPFVAINCAALPENLLESELFGYVEGAFTGAAKGGKKGLFEMAHKGTIFLDEIGDLSLKLQARLLRAIQEREIMRLGHDRVIPVDVRVISASNKSLDAAVRREQFREDLLYRLNVLSLSVPPLRERGEDVLLLAQYYIDQIQAKSGCALRGISKGAKSALTEYTWPGNVRELRNFCERLSVYCEGKFAKKQEVLTAMGGSGYEDSCAAREDERQEESHEKDFFPEVDEREKVMDALKQCRYSRKKAAAYLGIDVSTLYRKIKKYQIEL